MTANTLERPTQRRTCRKRGCNAPAEADHATLHGTSGEALLTAHAALTHRMHAIQAKHGTDHEEADLRAQRDVVAGEVLRRISNR